MEDLRECYRILEVEPGASLDEVKTSYRELVKVWHPDRFGHDPKLREKAVEKLKQINLAYERLSAAGETFRYSQGGTAKEEREERREYRRASDEDYTHTPREPPRQPPPPEPPPARQVWIPRLAPIAAGLGAAAVLAVVVLYLSPEPEPRFLIELPEPAVVEQQPTAAARTQRRARVEPQPTFKLPPEKFFGKGSTKEEVIAAQGRPDMATGTLFRYGTSDVNFENGKVVSWRNGFPRLKVKMIAAPNIGARNYFTVGSTKDQVIDAQGTPDSFTETSFTYGTSKVYFEGGRVRSWRIKDRPLNAKLLPKSDVGSPTHFTIGSSKDEVIAAQGTPDAFSDSEFDYGTSRVYFDRGRVISWDSRHPPLRVRSPG